MDESTRPELSRPIRNSRQNIRAAHAGSYDSAHTSKPDVADPHPRHSRSAHNRREDTEVFGLESLQPPLNSRADARIPHQRTSRSAHKRRQDPERDVSRSFHSARDTGYDAEKNDARLFGSPRNSIQDVSNTDGRSFRSSRHSRQDQERYDSVEFAPPLASNDSTEALSQLPHPERPTVSLPREIAFVAIIAAAQLLTQAGLGQAIAPLHIIGSSFGSPTPSQLSWFAAGYSLTVGSFILVAGRLGDIFGYKLLFLFGWSWYALWSLVAGFSIYTGSQIFFDFCRAMQGIGPALILPNALAILGHTYPPGKRKNMIFALFGATAPGGFVIGAAFSSLIAERLWWPWAYWCMAIACCLVLAAAFFIIPNPEQEVLSKKGIKSFDFLGAVVGVTGLILFNVAWNQAPAVGWGTPYVIILFFLGIMFIIAFFFVEQKVAHPLLPLEGLTGNVGFVLGCIALGWSSFGIWIYYLWQFWELLRLETPLSATAQLVPAAISGLCAAIATGVLLHTVRTAWVMVIAMGAFFIGNCLLATAPVDQTYWLQTFLAVVIMPWGMDMSFPAATIILSNFVAKENQGIAASLVNTIVNYSISIGLGIAGTVQSQVDPVGTKTLEGFRGAWYAAMGLSGCGILLSIYFVIDGYRQDRIDKAKEESKRRKEVGSSFGKVYDHQKQSNRWTFDSFQTDESYGLDG